MLIVLALLLVALIAVPMLGRGSTIGLLLRWIGTLSTIWIVALVIVSWWRGSILLRRRLLVGRMRWRRIATLVLRVRAVASLIMLLLAIGRCSLRRILLLVV